MKFLKRAKTNEDIISHISRLQMEVETLDDAANDIKRKKNLLEESIERMTQLLNSKKRWIIIGMDSTVYGRYLTKKDAEQSIMYHELDVLNDVTIYEGEEF